MTGFGAPTFRRSSLSWMSFPTARTTQIPQQQEDMPFHATRERASLGTALAHFPPSRSFASAASLTTHSRANANERSSATHLWLPCGPHWEPTLVWISTGEMNKVLVTPGMAPVTDGRTDCTQVYVGESMSWVRAVCRSMKAWCASMGILEVPTSEKKISLSQQPLIFYISSKGGAGPREPLASNS